VRILLLAVIAPLACAAQHTGDPPPELPAMATVQLRESLELSRPHTSHTWRDTPAMNADGTVNAYIEIPQGELRKWEFDMKANARAVDRVMPDDVGGYPINYGYVPQTVSYDGDPFDALVTGPPLEGGSLVRGAIVGLMFMEDEKGLDSKVVLSTLDADGHPRHALTDAEKRRVGEYFARYKLHEPGKFSKVPGWGSLADGLRHVTVAHAFFRECRQAQGPCVLRPGSR
jgi:inorganic pyrophosphatase